MARFPVFPSLALLGALSVLMAAVYWPEAEAAEDPGAGMGGGFHRFPATYARVARGDAVETVELVGDVVSSRRSTLTFERTGTLAAVHARMGDRVTAGQLLAELEDSVLQEELAAAQAALRIVVEEAALAERDAGRAEDVGADAVAESERDRLRSLATTAAAKVAQQEAEVRRLQALLRRGRLSAPFAGVIARRLLDEGAQAGAGIPVFDLLDPARREVRLEVPPPLVASLQTGSAVVLTLDERPDFELPCVLHALVPAADPGSRSFTAVLRLEQEDDQGVLLPGLFVRARLTLGRAAQQLLVPVDAVMEGAQGAVVVVADAPVEGKPQGTPDSARFVPVRILVRGAELVAVVPFQEGSLQAGARVLVTGVQNVYPGALLSLNEEF